MTIDADIKAADAVEAARLCATLTERERETLVLAAKGYHSAEIAIFFNRSVKTVDAYRTEIIKKLGVRTTIEAAVIATKAGLV